MTLFTNINPKYICMHTFRHYIASLATKRLNVWRRNVVVWFLYILLLRLLRCEIVPASSSKHINLHRIWSGIFTVTKISLQSKIHTCAQVAPQDTGSIPYVCILYMPVTLTCVQLSSEHNLANNKNMTVYQFCIWDNASKDLYTSMALWYITFSSAL